MISPGEIQFLIVEPPGRIDMHPTDAILIVSFTVKEFRNDAGHIGTGGIVQVFSNHIAIVGQSVGMTGRFGVEE